jgi:hypothetical protein
MKDGLRSDCKACVSALNKEYRNLYPERVKDAYYRKVYGISLAEYLEMVAAQDGGCAICGLPESASGKTLAVDHDPVTGSVRKILCHKCNAGLGHFNDNAEQLECAAKYLREHATTE